MALDVARGMAALEENDPPIVHRDLKPTNIFIDAGVHFYLDLTLGQSHLSTSYNSMQLYCNCGG